MYDKILPSCPHCGWVPPETVQEPLLPEVVDGAAVPLEQAAVKRVATPQQKRAAFDDLLRRAAAKGYKLGWAQYRFEALFGEQVPGHWSRAAYQVA